MPTVITVAEQDDTLDDLVNFWDYSGTVPLYARGQIGPAFDFNSFTTTGSYTDFYRATHELKMYELANQIGVSGIYFQGLPGQVIFGLEVPGLGISYRNQEAVVNFLVRNPEIISFVALAQPALVGIFGYPVNIILEVMTDPDHDGFEELVAWIQSSDNVDEGLEKLERFDDEWFLDHLDLVGNNFSFNIETR